MSDVKLLAKWTGWCDPCETERPLLLTQTGEHGLRAWLRGVGHEDRSLRLTCRVCGEWQDVPPYEDEVEEPVAVEVDPTIVAVRPLGQRQVTVARRSFAPYPVTSLPAPRPAQPTEAPGATADAPTSITPDDALLELLADGVDLISRAS